jgi:hypothetical protein
VAEHSGKNEGNEPVGSIYAQYASDMKTIIAWECSCGASSEGNDFAFETAYDLFSSNYMGRLVKCKKCGAVRKY